MIYFKGHKHSDETKRKIGMHKRTEEWKRKIGLAHQNEKHHKWKGDKVSYKTLHQWVRRHLPIPDLCEFCNQPNKLTVANITGIYDRDFKNWKYLCAKCHYEFDTERKLHTKAPETGRFTKN